LDCPPPLEHLSLTGRELTVTILSTQRIKPGKGACSMNFDRRRREVNTVEEIKRLVLSDNVDQCKNLTSQRWNRRKT
jgi:hypothetical protein